VIPIKLTILGKYGPYAKAGGACSSYLLQHAGENILIDCGNGGLAHLQRHIAVADISAVFLSHLHHDHVSDMHILRYALEGFKARGLKTKLPLMLYMPEQPENIAAFLKSTSVFDVKPAGEVIRLFGMDITWQAMTHPVPSFAIRFEADGKAFVYSGDTNMNGELAPFAKGVDLLLMDAALLSRDKKDNNVPHVSALEAGLIASQANVKRLIGTHIYPMYEEGEVKRELCVNYSQAEIAQENTTYII
jgi:ribonuclease BN (tRNA processing enzyme)